MTTRNQRYRNRLRETLGNEEYKKQQAQKKRDYRAKIKQQKTPKSNLTQNQKNLKKIYETIYKKPFNVDDLKHFLNNSKKIIKTIETFTNNDNGRRKYLSSIMSLITDKQSKIYQIYKNEFTKYNNIVQDKLSDNLMTKNERDNILSWEIITNEIKPKILKYGTTQEKLLISLYTNIPPRRNEFTQYLKIIKQDILPQKLDNNFNYIYYHTGKIILNKYKTYHLYNQQFLHYPKKDLKSLQKLLDSFDDGELLFKTNKNKPYVSFNLITKMFMKYSGKKISTRLLRHSFITDFVRKHKVLSIRQKQIISYQLGHSSIEFDKYVRVDMI